MLAVYQGLIARQYEAALCMLASCIENCSEANWNAPVANLQFCQATFHALMFTDLYLGPDLESMRRQPFHLEHADVFADYEELEDRVQQATYERSFLAAYLQHCRDKAVKVLAAETVETLAQPAGFEWLKFSRAELHVTNIRHIQHHAAQLSLRLRLDTGEGVAWAKSGWQE